MKKDIAKTCSGYAFVFLTLHVDVLKSRILYPFPDLYFFSFWTLVEQPCKDNYSKNSTGLQKTSYLTLFVSFSFLFKLCIFHMFGKG